MCGQGNSNAESYIEDNVLRPYLCVWNHLWNSCQAVYENEIMYQSIELLFMEKLALIFSFFLSKAKLVEPLCVALYHEIDATPSNISGLL